MKKKAIIIIVIVVIVIIIGIVGFIIYRNSKNRKEQEAQQQMMLLQQQLNPNMPVAQRSGILEQIANLAAAIQASKDSAAANTPSVDTVTSPVYSSPTTTSTPEPLGFPLKNGSSNSYVKTAQQAINIKCGKKLVADGKFGPLTQAGAVACIGTPTISWSQYQTLVG